MRTQKAFINVTANIGTFSLLTIITFLSRKYFLNYLGPDIAGLGSLFQNVVGLLGIAELGIGSAIIFSLYKPINENDYVKVVGLIHLYRNFYRGCSVIILLGGIIFIPFLRFFVTGDIEIKKVIIYFSLFLGNTILTYWFSYKFCLLYATQNNYIVTSIDFLTKVIMNSLQIIFLVVFQSYLVFLTVMTISNCIYLIVLNIIVNKKYMYLRQINGKLENEDRNRIWKNVRSLALHKLGGIITLGTDNLLISYFLNLKTVAIYGNYALLIGFATTLVDKLYEGITASVGNLLLEDSIEKKYTIFNKLFFLNFWISSFLTISLYNTIDQFITLWIGEEYILDRFTLYILLVNFYFFSMRPVIERFKVAGGLYNQDRYAPLIEATINLISSIIFVQMIGLSGIFLGTFISNICVIFWVKPKIVFNYVFKRSVIDYFNKYFGNLVYLMVPLVITTILTNEIKQYYTWGYFLLNCVINIIVINGVFFLMFRKKEEFTYFFHLSRSMFNKINQTTLKSSSR